MQINKKIQSIQSVQLSIIHSTFRIRKSVESLTNMNKITFGLLKKLIFNQVMIKLQICNILTNCYRFSAIQRYCKEIYYFTQNTQSIQRMDGNKKYCNYLYLSGFIYLLALNCINKDLIILNHLKFNSYEWLIILLY